MRLRLSIAVAATTALLAGPALAAPAHTATLNASATTFAWDGAAGSSIGEVAGGFPSCADLTTCEDVLLNIEAPGELAVTLESPDGMEGPDCLGSPCFSGNDFDAYIYKSNAAGEATGEPLGDEETDCSSSYPSESCKLTVEPGHYLVHVVYFLTFESAYKGTATLTATGPGVVAPAAPGTTTPPPAGQPAPPPQSQPAPASQPAPQSKPAPSQSAAAKKKKALKKCKAKAKKKKNAKKRKQALKRCAKKYR